MPDQNETRYHLVVRNRPGELAKLTKVLSEQGVELLSLTVANIGDMASIQFSAAGNIGIPEKLLRSGVKPR